MRLGGGTLKEASGGFLTSQATFMRWVQSSLPGTRKRPWRGSWSQPETEKYGGGGGQYPSEYSTERLCRSAVVLLP